jgi:hypothetical protein
MLIATITILALPIASVVAFWASVREARRMRHQPSSLLFRIALALSGVGAALLAYAAGQAVFPLVRMVVWPVVRATTGLSDQMEYHLGIYDWEQLVVMVGTASVLSCAIGLAVGRLRRVAPFDGYWLWNPLSVGVGYHCLHSFTMMLGLDPADQSGWTESWHWGASVWYAVVVWGWPINGWLLAYGAGLGRRWLLEEAAA